MPEATAAISTERYSLSIVSNILVCSRILYCFPAIDSDLPDRSKLISSFCMSPLDDATLSALSDTRHSAAAATFDSFDSIPFDQQISIHVKRYYFLLSQQVVFSHLAIRNPNPCGKYRGQRIIFLVILILLGMD